MSANGIRAAWRRLVTGATPLDRRLRLALAACVLMGAARFGVWIVMGK